MSEFLHVSEKFGHLETGEFELSVFCENVEIVMHALFMSLMQNLQLHYKSILPEKLSC